MAYTPTFDQPPLTEADWQENMGLMNDKQPYFSLGGLPVGTIEIPEEVKSTGLYGTVAEIHIPQTVKYNDTASKQGLNAPEYIDIRAGAYIIEPLNWLLEQSVLSLPQVVWHHDAPSANQTTQVLLAAIQGPPALSARGVVERTGFKGQVKLHDVEVTPLEQGTLYLFTDGAVHRGSRQFSLKRMVARVGFMERPDFSVISSLDRAAHPDQYS